MADLSNIPKQSLFQSTLKSPINSTQTTGVILNDVLSYTPGGETLYLSLLDTNNPEVISFTGQNASGELTGVTRGIALADGGSSSASAHGAGITVVLSNPYNLYEDIQAAINAKVDTGGDTITGLIDFSGSGRIQVPVFADSTARDAAIPSPVNGLMVYSTADGEFQAYQSGAWVSVSSGSTQPNATETVAGKVELATQSEANAGTATGGTGASLVVTPDKLAIINQNNPHTYNTTGGSSNAYTLDLTPNVGSLSAGQIFLIKANHTNTGASTLDIDGIGATAIYKAKGEVIEAGNIQADELYLVAYDGAQFQLLNPNLAPSRGDIVIGKGAGDVTTLPAGTDGQIIIYDSTEPNNFKQVSRYMIGTQDQNAYSFTRDLTSADTTIGSSSGSGTFTADLSYNFFTVSATYSSSNYQYSGKTYRNTSGKNGIILEGNILVNEIQTDGILRFNFGLTENIVLTEPSNSTNQSSAYIYINSSKDFVFGSRATGSAENTTLSISNNTSYLVRIEVDSSGARCYLNNVLVANHTSEFPSAGDLETFYIMGVGGDGSGTEQAEFSVSNFRETYLN